MSAVDVNAILGEMHGSREGAADITTATLTLLAYTDERHIVNIIRERAEAILQRHPARVVLLDATREPGEHTASLEWIDIGVRDVSVAEIASVAHALTLQDVPTVLVWAARETMRNPAFAALNELSNSLVLDSSRMGSDASGLRELTGYFSQDRRYAVQDLAYLRLAPWQEMIADFFDENELAGDLASLQSVAIVAGSQAEALYLLGWLASRLGWKSVSPGSFASPSGAPIAYSISMEGSPRRVRSVELASQENVFRAALDEGSDETVCLTVEGAKARPRHCEPLHDISNVALIERAILMPQTSDVFRATLEAVRELL